MKVAFEALHGVSRQGFDTISPAKRVLVPGARLKDWAKRASQQVPARCRDGARTNQS